VVSQFDQKRLFDMMEQKHRIEMQRKDTELTSKLYEMKKEQDAKES
jgi:hypothetical protein